MYVFPFFIYFRFPHSPLIQFTKLKGHRSFDLARPTHHVRHPRVPALAQRRALAHLPARTRHPRPPAHGRVPQRDARRGDEGGGGGGGGGAKCPGGAEEGAEGDRAGKDGAAG